MSVAFGDLQPTTRRLVLARALRSVGQGALVVDFALYLNALGWDGARIGLILTGAGLFGAVLSLFVGPLSDRLRRKPFLLAYESLALLCALTALLTAQPVILSVAAIVGGFGRGASGAAGPFSPAEQAWLAEEVLPARRGMVYSLNTALGFFGMTFGALIGMAPAFWGHSAAQPVATLSGVPAVAYRPLFMLFALSSIANLALLSQAHEAYRGTKATPGTRLAAKGAEIRRKENHILTILVLINSFNGAAIGLTGPLISYWFALRFHVGPAAIAPVMAVTFALTGLSSLVTGRLTQHVGVVQSVVWTRLAGLVLLVLLPLAPAYWLASLLYLLRSVFNRGSAGARQALAIGLVREERRGLVTSLNNASFQFPQSIGPTVAGALLDAGQFSLPFYVAAVLQAIYLALYGRIFRRYEPARGEQAHSARVERRPADPEDR